MTSILGAPEIVSDVILWGSAVLVTMLTALILSERAAFAFLRVRRAQIAAHYRPVVQRALAGDAAAQHVLSVSPRRHRLPIARLLILPLVHDRDATRIDGARTILRAMSFPPVVRRYVRSRLAWRRAVALHVLGLLELREHTAAVVAALDDPDRAVRSAALDALTDLREPSALAAIVTRLHDASLPHGQRVSALTALGSRCEPLLLDLLAVDPNHAVNYAAALGLCGTALSRPALCRLTADPRNEVREAALDALGRVGVDELSAAHALAALDSADDRVRAAAAGALSGWAGAGVESVSRLAGHLDDTWAVATRAAHTLRSMGAAGVGALEARAAGQDSAGDLARYVLWHQPGLHGTAALEG